MTAVVVGLQAQIVEKIKNFSGIDQVVLVRTIPHFGKPVQVFDRTGGAAFGGIMFQGKFEGTIIQRVTERPGEAQIDVLGVDAGILMSNSSAVLPVIEIAFRLKELIREGTLE